MGTTFFGPGGPARFLGHVHHDCGALAEEDLVVHPLSESQWRISDRRYPENDACSLLGFIEAKDDRFELTQLEHGFRWFSFSSLAEAIAHFTQTPQSSNLTGPELSRSPQQRLIDPTHLTARSVGGKREVDANTSV